jgi:hypothetical protein
MHGMLAEHLLSASETQIPMPSTFTHDEAEGQSRVWTQGR